MIGGPNEVDYSLARALRFILDFEHGVGDPNEVDYSLARAARRRRHQMSVSSDPSGGLVRGLFDTREASLPPCSAMPINVPGQSEPQPLSKVAGPVVRDIGGRRRPWRALRTGYSIDGGEQLGSQTPSWRDSIRAAAPGLCLGGSSAAPLSESALLFDWHLVTRYCRRAVTPRAYNSLRLSPLASERQFMLTRWPGRAGRLKPDSLIVN